MSTTTKIKIFAINALGTGGPPQATEETLQFFQPAYVMACLSRAMFDDRLTEEARQLAREAADELSEGPAPHPFTETE